MEDDTINFLRSLCAKVKEVATLCDAYLENESRKNKKIPQPPSDDPEHPGNRIIPISKWPEFHEWPTENGLRHMIFMSHQTGADYFVRRAGRRVLISEKAFFEWVEMSKEERAKASKDITLYQLKFGKR